MDIHAEISLNKALTQVNCLQNQGKVEPGQCRIYIYIFDMYFSLLTSNLDYSIVLSHEVFPHTCKRSFF